MILSACFTFFWLFFATAYNRPAKNPTPTADTDPKVIGSPKKSIPDAATGSLFKAPTILRSSKLATVIKRQRFATLPISCATRHPHTPCRSIRDTNCSCSRKGDREYQEIASLWRTVVSALRKGWKLIVITMTHKFCVRFSDPQSSNNNEKTARTGMLNKLL